MSQPHGVTPSFPRPAVCVCSRGCRVWAEPGTLAGVVPHGLSLEVRLDYGTESAQNGGAGLERVGQPGPLKSTLPHHSPAWPPAGKRVFCIQ